MDQQYAPSGPGVVSHRTMEHVGYNGFEFRKLAACPEMNNRNDPLVQESFLASLLAPEEFGGAGCSVEPMYSSESIKCAPENCVVRHCVRHFAGRGNIVARYPPRNMLNAKYKNPPRETAPWKITPTYEEPPFPITENTAASSALMELYMQNKNPSSTVNVLDVLRVVYKHMEDHAHCSDKWLQHNVTRPTNRAIEQYEEELCVYQLREKGVGQLKGCMSTRTRGV